MLLWTSLGHDSGGFALLDTFTSWSCTCGYAVTGPCAFCTLALFTRWILDILSTSVCTWHALGPMFTRQSTISFGRTSVYLRGDCAQAVRTWKSGHDCTLFRNIWLHSGYMFLDCSLRLLNGFPVFLREPEPGSCGRFTCSSWVFSGRAPWRSVHSRCFDCVDCLSSWHEKS